MNNYDRSNIDWVIQQLNDISRIVLKMKRCKDKDFVVEIVKEQISRFEECADTIQEIADGEYEKYENISYSSFGDGWVDNDDRANPFLEAHEQVLAVAEKFDTKKLDGIVNSLVKGEENDMVVDFSDLIAELEPLKSIKTKR